jgi:hypothetical protein
MRGCACQTCPRNVDCEQLYCETIAALKAKLAEVESDNHDLRKSYCTALEDSAYNADLRQERDQLKVQLAEALACRDALDEHAAAVADDYAEIEAEAAAMREAIVGHRLARHGWSSNGDETDAALYVVLDGNVAGRALLAEVAALRGCADLLHEWLETELYPQRPASQHEWVRGFLSRADAALARLDAIRKEP